tara:strand:+ start:1073 stop:2491 length:1419 start_codon:yes stop_codon:yes gene_type:complete
MSSKINKTDKELLITNTPFNYSSIENTYFGGYFGNDSEDYVEVLIYDTNDNLLETSVADSNDYYYDSEKGGIKLKTGTILRKLGYDRGKFKVTYNFLRKSAGSYETVVTDINDEIFNGEVDVNEIDNTLFIKENKYIVHQISPSRTELRLVIQNIRDEKYVRDFYNLARRKKKVTADTSEYSKIRFVGLPADQPSSTQIEFVPPAGFADVGHFDQSMTGGTISIPNFFLVDKIFPPPVLSAEDVGLTEFEVISTETDIYQASFFLDTNAGGPFELKKNNSGKFGDTKFAPAYTRFKDLILGQESQTFQQWDDGVDFEGDGRTLDDVRNLSDSTFNCVYLKWKDPNPVIDIVSNSFLRADVETEYIWEITGFDKDGNDFNAIQPRPIGQDEGGDFQIVSVPGDASYANPDSQSMFRAIHTVGGGSGDGNTRSGSRLRLTFFSKNCHIGIKLTINDNVANDSSTLHLPTIIETH